MTSNQIAYWNLEEQKRANRESEKLKGDTLGETTRANKAEERINIDKNQLQREKQEVEARRAKVQNAKDTVTTLTGNRGILGGITNFVGSLLGIN